MRLVYRTPDWENFVHLAVTEVRQFGGKSIQIARRLRGMLENLIQTLPEERTAVLRQELDLLERSTKRFFPEAEDRAMAKVSDSQGVGGKQATAEGSMAGGPAPTHEVPISGSGDPTEATAKEIADVLKKRFQEEGWIN